MSRYHMVSLSRYPMVSLSLSLSPTNAQQKKTYFAKLPKKSFFPLFLYPMCAPALNSFGGGRNTKKNK